MRARDAEKAGRPDGQGGLGLNAAWSRPILIPLLVVAVLGDDGRAGPPGRYAARRA